MDTDRETDRLTDIQTDKQTNRQTDRQTDTHTHTHTHTHKRLKRAEAAGEIPRRLEAQCPLFADPSPGFFGQTQLFPFLVTAHWSGFREMSNTSGWGKSSGSVPH